MSADSNSKRTITFLGASGGVGLAALSRALAAGHTCVALCRTPSKLTDRFPEDKHPNLIVMQGNAHDASAVARCLVARERPADTVVSSIGGVFKFSCMTIDDPQVCQKGMAALLEAIAQVRKERALTTEAAQWRPRIVVVSTCGISKAGRDFPLATLPIYKFMLRVPHEDKVEMERLLLEGAGAEAEDGKGKGTGKGYGYSYTIVRPSLLNDEAQPERAIRSGVDDKPPVGYAISRDDTGRWIFENLLDGESREEYANKIVTITW
ncbi:NAD(P)-binding protein [Hypoxylon sp. FL0543]|nr:NAD(P)-binding protein [Hypoxylon sp. FL0543]